MQKKKGIQRIVVLILLLVGFQWVSSVFFFRLDLTADKRHTIHPATKAVLKNLNEVVLVKVYLEGDLPASFKRLRQATEETLEEFQVYGKANIQYEFVDPELITEVKAKNEFMLSMAQKGIQPTNIFVKEEGRKIEKLIFPGAVVTYRGKETAVMLLKSNSASDPNEVLNQSAENVEYEFISAISRLTKDKKKRIAILGGHGEPENIRFADIAMALKDAYEVKRLDLTKTDLIRDYHAIVLAQPTKAFSDEDVLKIDQFILHGGRALFLMDPIRINLDSLGQAGSFIFPYELNLDDLFFKYGIRLNKDLLQDLYCSQIPMTVGNLGDKPRIELVPWTFFPLLNTFGKHPLLKSLDAIQTRFLSSVDTVKAVGIRKTALLSTSEYTKTTTILGRVDLNQMRNDPDPKLFHGGTKTVAYLLEGKFRSPFTNRPITKPQGFMSEGIHSAIIVVSDGDLILNEVNPKNGEPTPLGFDTYQRKMYSNKDFILNSLNYLLDEDRLIGVKNKEIVSRPLDKLKIKEEKRFYQVLNVAVPPVLVFLLWLLLSWHRKRKFGSLR